MTAAIIRNDTWYEEFKSELPHERLRRCRKHYGWNQEELAFRAGISQTSLSKIEACRTQPTIKTLSKLEEALNLPTGYLYAEAISKSDKHNLQLVEAVIREIRENKFSNEQIENIMFSVQEYSRLNKYLVPS